MKAKATRNSVLLRQLALLFRVTTKVPTDTRIIVTMIFTTKGILTLKKMRTSDRIIIEAQRNFALGRITRLLCQSRIPSPATGRFKSQA